MMRNLHRWLQRGHVPVLGLLVLLGMACSGEDSFHGTVLDPAEPAPPFQLQDQFGRSVALSELQGKVVALTFLYTYCPDICPIVTETLRWTHVMLGDEAMHVEFLAITVDPQRDSVRRANGYSREKGMLDRWHFLVGSEERLRPIWRSYWLDPVREVSGQLSAPDHDRTGGVGPGSAAESDANNGTTTSGYLIGHNAPVFLIDRQGYRRVVFTDLGLDPQPLVHDIRVLIKEDP